MIPLDRVLKTPLQFKGSYIGGNWLKAQRASGSIEVISPANMEWVLPTLNYSFDHVDEAVNRAQKAYPKWKALTLHERISMVTKFGDELAKRQGEIADVMAVESGKPLEECSAEAALLQNKIKVTVEYGLKLVESQFLDLGPQGRGEIHWMPKGVLVVVGPFNFPLHLNHGHIVPALLVGNVCILKPSEKVPYSAQFYAEAADSAGIPPGVLQVVQGPGEMGARLCKHVGVDGVMATCSYDVGSRIQKDLADKPEKIVALEMGGKNAALVWQGTDLEACAQALIKSAFLTTGQRCTALSRVYVTREMLVPLAERVHELAKQLIISHPFDTDPVPFMGPLISAAAKDKFLRYAGIAEGERAEPLMRPKALEGKTRLNRKPLPIGHYVSPSINVVAKSNPKSTYQHHEVFGPDIFFCPIDSLEEGIEAVNSNPYGLVCSIFGGDEALFNKVAAEIECGLIYSNRATVGASARLPFGGWKRSGNQRPAGIFAIYSSSQPQARILS